MFANDKVVFGNKYYGIGETYYIGVACNHHDFLAVLKYNYTPLYVGTEVELLDKVHKPQGTFARVRNIYTNVIYDIDYNYLGESVNEQTKRELEEEKKRKERKGT